MTVLNPTLYAALQRAFGDVRIGQRGQPAIKELGFRPNGAQYWQEKHGEAYYVNCPFCKETRKRLHISHLWCVRDDQAETSHKSYIHCFNTDGLCTDDPYNRDALLYRVYGSLTYRQLPSKASLHLPDAREQPLQTEMPGDVVSLRALPLTHSACRYVISRGFSPEWLADTYGVGYCTTAVSPYYTMQHRLFVPITMRGKLEGWQGRYLGNIDFKKMQIPKYYTYRYLGSNVLYNYDVACKYDVIVITEGVTKAWVIGPQSMCYFGVLTAARAAELSQVLKPDGRIVFLPDGDTWRPLQNGNVKAVKMLNTLYQYMPASQIVPLQLPDGMDPGDMLPADCRNMIVNGLRYSGWTGDYDHKTDFVPEALQPRRRYIPES